ncbi:polysaccharide deacetylase family protein [Defluviitalea phaphyphila]|uniref:polysaccharide deacetylase family protein n=1 Tax=Defluviitalea phaphyphila TaxID=1473580 RepID=UPI0007305FD6|nr:polysaccharide deacetylase family protein [Defluviitalea phaphyphila]
MLKKLVFILFIPLIIIGCSQNKDVSEKENNIIEKEIDILQKDNATEEKNDLLIEEENKKTEEKVEIDYKKIKPNELGHIMIVMYHGLVEDNPPSPYQRTIEDFKKDLEFFYENGYRPISMRDYIDNNISVEAGYTPIVITFDDGVSSSFSLVEENGELKPAPNCAVDIMNEFAKTHPGFEARAIFYINGDNDPFKGAGSFKERLEYLINNGYEVANHTYSHAHLSEIDEEEIQEEIGKVDEMIKEALPGYTVDSFSYPFGERPVEELRYLIEKGIYNGKEYNYKIGLREGPSAPFYPIYHIKFDPYNVPRVRGSEGKEGDLWWYLEYYKNHPEYRYISDGNPNRISIPKGYEENIDKNSLGDKELYIYTIEE